jgi:hypothetical protein
MKQVIERKVYNTETARQIAEWSNNLGRSDYYGVEETLYVSRKGQHFLHYWGGAASKYAENGPGYSSEGCGIELLSPDKAVEWLESKGYASTLEEEFPEYLEEG